MILEITNLSKSYGTQKALDSINISIEKNEIIGLLGPNGAGKSTLMKSIAGVINIEEGTIHFLEKNISKEPEETKSKLGYLPENNPLYLEMFVKEYLQFVGDIHSIPVERIHEVISLVGLSNEQNKKIHQLSKGYKQRVGLAQAILHQPELLILDEPTNGLDPNQILEIRSVISEIGKEKTILLSTHIMQEVEALCTRVILLNKGRIVQDCPIQDFQGKFDTLEHAFSSYTQN